MLPETGISFTELNILFCAVHQRIYSKNDLLNVHICEIYLYPLHNFQINKFTFEREIFARSGHSDCWFRDFDHHHSFLSLSAEVEAQNEVFLAARGQSHAHNIFEIFEPASVLSIT